MPTSTLPPPSDAAADSGGDSTLGPLAVQGDQRQVDQCPRTALVDVAQAGQRPDATFIEVDLPHPSDVPRLGLDEALELWRRIWDAQRALQDELLAGLDPHGERWRAIAPSRLHQLATWSLTAHSIWWTLATVSCARHHLDDEGHLLEDLLALGLPVDVFAPSATWRVLAEIRDLPSLWAAEDAGVPLPEEVLHV